MKAAGQTQFTMLIAKERQVVSIQNLSANFWQGNETEYEREWGDKEIP
jgi:hypothetical protein